MSRGPGHVQREIVAIFTAQPSAVFSTAELAALVYAGEIVAKRHTDAVDRALRKLAPELGLTCCRARPWKVAGWYNVWGLASNTASPT